MVNNDKNNNRPVLGVVVSLETKDAIKKAAIKEDRTVSQFLRIFLEKHFGGK